MNSRGKDQPVVGRWIPLPLLLGALLLGIPAFPSALEMAVSGDRQEGRIAHSLSEPYGVVVTDSLGRPVEGLSAMFRIEGPSSGAKLTTTETTTDAQGSASTYLVLGKEMGDYNVRALLRGPSGEILEHVFRSTAVDWRKLIFWVLGGLGLFLFGMLHMSDALQKGAGDRMKRVLSLLTRNRFVGVGVGALVTGVIQSSSATTVMLVGFVNAGLVAFRDVVSVVMGANIGTTVTGQIIAFPIQQYALPAIAIGLAMTMMARRRAVKLWGQVILGFGILFLGLNTMTAVFEPIKNGQTFQGLFISLGRYPLLGLLAGAAVTMILQSSSATVAMTMALAATGLIDVQAAVPLVLGENIGTTITAWIASTHTSLAARRTARAHFAFNALGAAYMLAGIYLLKVDGVPIYYKLVDFFTQGHLYRASDELLFTGNTARFVANSHTIFNVFNVLVFLPLLPLLVKVAELMVPGKEEVDQARPRYLEEHLLATPAIALSQATKEIVRMAGIARDAVQHSTTAFIEGDKNLPDQVRKEEEAVDGLQHEITKYLVALSQRALDPHTAQELPVLLHTVNDLERVGDHAVNIVELAERKRDRKLAFTDKALSELEDMHQVVDEMAQATTAALENEDKDAAAEALTHEERLNKLQRNLRKNHVARMEKGKCDALSGIVFIDMVDNYEKIGDHLTNIAQAVQGGLQWDGQTPD